MGRGCRGFGRCLWSQELTPVLCEWPCIDSSSPGLIWGPRSMRRSLRAVTRAAPQTPNRGKRGLLALCVWSSDLALSGAATGLARP
jgi:hypothetical protein